MAFEKAKTSLGFIEEKLAKLLGLAGQINASFSPEIKPVIIQDDLTGPGVSTFRGRHWTWSTDTFTVGAANTTNGIRFGVPVIVECMWLAGSPIDGGGAGVNTRFPVHILSPAVALGANPLPTLTNLCASWVDNKLVESDSPPIFDGNGNQTGTAAAFAQLTRLNRVWVGGFAGGSILNGLMTTPPGWKGMHLPANGELRGDVTKLGAGTNLTWGIMGRIA